MNQRPRNGQDWDPGHYQRHASFVAELGRPVVDLLAPRAGERVLDLGCGDGRLTEALVAAGCAVVGVDSSAEQVAAARARGLDARVMDGQALDFDGEFDAVFSNAALHWMTEPHRVLDGVFARSFLAPLPAAEREPFRSEVAATLAPTLRRPDGRWFVDYVRLRFAARKPAGTRP